MTTDVGSNINLPSQSTCHNNTFRQWSIRPEIKSQTAAVSFMRAVYDHDLVETCRAVTDGVKPDCLDGMALVFAAKHGHLDITTMLMVWENTKWEISPALNIAIENGHIPVVVYLLNFELTNIQKDEAFVLSAKYGHFDIVKCMSMVWSGHALSAKCLENALVASKNARITEFILEYKGNARAPRADVRDGLALITAAESGRVDVINALMWSTTSPKVTCRNAAALVAATENNDLITFQALIDHMTEKEKIDWIMIEIFALKFRASLADE